MWLYVFHEDPALSSARGKYFWEIRVCRGCCVPTSDIFCGFLHGGVCGDDRYK